jgi:hypothetical protein
LSILKKDDNPNQQQQSLKEIVLEWGSSSSAHGFPGIFSNLLSAIVTIVLLTLSSIAVVAWIGYTSARDGLRASAERQLMGLQRSLLTLRWLFRRPCPRQAIRPRPRCLHAPAAAPPQPPLLQLREYQLEAIDAVLDKLIAKTTNCMETYKKSPGRYTVTTKAGL